MRSNVIAALASLALVTPALAQQGTVYDEQSGSWTTDAPPGPGYDADPTGSPGPGNVDVSVDLAAPGASVSFETFHDGLAPYGDWVTVGSYGRAWRPRVAAGWRPYYYGRWEWTDEGWLWVSDEPFGWAAYHYGRWAYDSYNGWVWIPGYQWAPAWVTWRYSPDYIGWAPLGPGFSVYVTSYPVHYGWWTFVPCRRFVGVPIHSVAFTGSHVRGIWGATHPAPPRATMFGARAPAWGGPARPFVEQRVGRAITPVRVQPVASPALAGAARQPGVVHVYRPEARLPVARPAAPAGAVGVRPGAPSAPSPAAGLAQRPGVVSSPNTTQRPGVVSSPNTMRGPPPSVGQPHPAAGATGALRSAPQPVRPQQQWPATPRAPAAAAPRAFQGQPGAGAVPSAPAPHAPGPVMRTPQQYAPQHAPAPAPQHAPAPAPAARPRPQSSYAPSAPARQQAAAGPSAPPRQFTAPPPAARQLAAAPRSPPSGGHAAPAVAARGGGARGAAQVHSR